MEIQGYPDYLIYDDGRVWSKKGKGRFLKPAKNQKGYHQVCLWRDGEQKNNRIARLVALHYIPNPENKPEVDHIDRDKDNNHISNLRWVTSQENNDNRGMTNRNTSGHEYISYHKMNKGWVFQYRGNGHNVRKYFKTFDEAIAFKCEYLSG